MGGVCQRHSGREGRPAIYAHKGQTIETIRAVGGRERLQVEEILQQDSHGNVAAKQKWVLNGEDSGEEGTAAGAASYLIIGSRGGLAPGWLSGRGRRGGVKMAAGVGHMTSLS